MGDVRHRTAGGGDPLDQHVAVGRRQLPFASNWATGSRRAYSKSQTALEGGALGWRKGSELPTFLSDVVARLKPGEVSEPLRTPTGYHIVRLNDERGGTPLPAFVMGADRS